MISSTKHEIASLSEMPDRNIRYVMNNVMNIAIIIIIGDKMKLP